MGVFSISLAEKLSGQTGYSGRETVIKSPPARNRDRPGCALMLQRGKDKAEAKRLRGHLGYTNTFRTPRRITTYTNCSPAT